MYPDHAFYEFYPKSVCDKVLAESGQTTNNAVLHGMCQREWIKQNPAQAESYGYKA